MALGADELRAKGVDAGGDDERGEKQSKLLTSRKHTQQRQRQQQQCRRRSGAFFCRGRRSIAAEKKLRAYARRHGLTPTGILLRIYLEGPPQHKDPAKFVTQVALPLEEE